MFTLRFSFPLSPSTCELLELNIRSFFSVPHCLSQSPWSVIRLEYRLPLWITASVLWWRTLSILPGCGCLNSGMFCLLLVGSILHCSFGKQGRVIECSPPGCRSLGMCWVVWSRSLFFRSHLSKFYPEICDLVLLPRLSCLSLGNTECNCPSFTADSCWGHDITHGFS